MCPNSSCSPSSSSSRPCSDSCEELDPELCSYCRWTRVTALHRAGLWFFIIDNTVWMLAPTAWDLPVDWVQGKRFSVVSWHSWKNPWGRFLWFLLTRQISLISSNEADFFDITTWRTSWRTSLASQHDGPLPTSQLSDVTTWRTSLTSQHDGPLWRHNMADFSDVTTWRISPSGFFSILMPMFSLDFIKIKLVTTITLKLLKVYLSVGKKLSIGGKHWDEQRCPGQCLFQLYIGCWKTLWSGAVGFPIFSAPPMTMWKQFC